MKEEKLSKLRNVFVICESPVILSKLRENLSFLNTHLSSISRFKSVDNAMEHLNKLIADQREVDLIISDIFFHASDISVVALIHRLEEFRHYRNTPLLIYTNTKEKALINQIRLACIHVPFRIVFTETDGKEVEKIFHDLISFKQENKHYLELEAKVEFIIESQNRNFITQALQTIHAYHRKYPKVCRFAKTELLKAQLFYAFWKLSCEQADKISSKLNFHNSESSEYKFLTEQFEKETTAGKQLLSLCEQALERSHESEPGYWKTLDLLFQLQMEKGEIRQAKNTLLQLIENFPNACTYALKLGKIHELRNEFHESVKHYMDAAHLALQQGIKNVQKEDLIDIVDTSLRSCKEMMQRLGVGEVGETHHFAEGSDNLLILKSIRKNNAQLRVMLEKMSKLYPDDANYMNKIAITYRRSGEYQLAEQYYLKAINLEPKNIIIRINYAMCLACSSLFKKATTVIEATTGMEMTEEERDILEHARELINKRDIMRIKRVML